MNTFLTALADCCAGSPLDEKRLVAPTLRVGNQWLDAVARSGRPALNVRVETLRSLAVGLAEPLLARAGLDVAPRRAETLLVERLLRELPPGRLRYLGAALPGPGLTATLLATLSGLRAHGVGEASLRDAALEDPGKAADLRLLAAAYDRLLVAEGLADYARVLAAAIERLASEPDALGPGTLVLVAGDFAPPGLEGRLLERIPAPRLRRLAVDPPGVPAAVRFACAVGAANEVRAVLRSCLERGIALDEVEVLHTDAEYTLAIFETFAALDRGGAPGAADGVAEAPVTFAEGLPCALSRPGRALAAWMRWLADGFPQPALVAMLREGLLETGGADGEQDVGQSRLAALLRAIPIGRERARYLEKIDEAVAAARGRLEAAGEEPAAGGEDGDGREESDEQRRERLGRRVVELETLRRVVARLLDASPADEADAAALVAAARRFLDTCARSVGRTDEFAAQRLREELKETADWIERAGGGAPRDVRAWIAALPAETTVGGSGPRPGCVHVDHVRSGGHSGRPHLFVLGLDEARFPGAGLQDPLLLDAERRAVDPALPTAAARLEQTLADFRRLLGRQRGAVTLSWPSRAVVEDAERFPSQAVLDVYREASGDREADQRTLLLAAGRPAARAPESPEGALDPGEWLLWRFTTDQAVANAGEVLARHAPHLVRGLNAAAERASAAFTPWDGRVPAAGADLDPTAPTGKVLSSNGLETAGACPRRFFYHYALDLAPPEELVLDPSRWLDPLTAGSLLHELFELYVREIVRAGRPADFKRGCARILVQLEQLLAVHRARYPVPSAAVYVREYELLVQAAKTFVREEEGHALRTGSEPAFLEASFGLPAGAHATALDHPEAVPVGLPDGRSIRTRGRVDRIDRGATGWEIWDYKTGGTWGFDRADPFHEGRKIQPYLYGRMVERRLRETVDPRARVTSFGYFFPGAKGRGVRMAWDAARLMGGAETLAELCTIIASGAFAATTDARDCAWCDYRRACGDVAAQAAATVRKIGSGEPLLAPMARLRALVPGNGGDAPGGEP
jgi:ATP-dependent helicase/nuclease subunit B